MSEMIETVAKALEPKCRAFGRGDMPMQVAREFARAAIEAMREPTDAMKKAADMARPMYDDPPTSGEDYWDYMIDAALTDNQPSLTGGEK